MNKLLIIESPNKIHTINKYLKDDNFKIIATIGHIRDLPSNSLGFDEKTLEPRWIIPSSKKGLQPKSKIVANIKEEAKKADEIYLATDPDREGEAISWHVYSILPDQDKTKCKRITFNEITKPAILAALEHPRDLDDNWIHSQFARRLLDRLVGYKVSKEVRKKTGGRSAGRVQSVALKMIYDREQQIKHFKPVDWWTLDPISTKYGKLILREIDPKLKNIKINKTNDESVSGVDFKDLASAEKVKADLTKKFKIYRIEKPKHYFSNPKEPYKTSTLQQDAINRLKWSVTKATFVAQKLYEGVKIDNEYVALISYPRTDSVRISPYFTEQAKKFITSAFGAKYFQIHKQTSDKNNANVQDAHEAIRVIDPFITPKSIKNKVEKEEYELYNLIWCRTIASFMTPAQYENTVVRIINNENKFYTYSRILVEPGYKKIYFDDTELPTRDLCLSDSLLGKTINDIKTIEIKKHTSEPPARYTQASLIRELDNAGVGRPSTYRSMANMAIERGYAQLNSHSYQMLSLGDDVVKFLGKNFDFIMDKDFTKSFENQLDLIAEGKLDWKSPIKEFQPILNKSIKKAEKVDNMSNFINRKCPECGGNLVYRFTKDKGIRFIGCNNYPKCKYNEFPNAFQPKKTGLKCPECGGDLVIKISKRKRKFVGCSNYPTCNFIMKTDSGMIKTIETAVNENKIPDVKVEKAVFEKKVIKQKENKKK